MPVKTALIRDISSYFAGRFDSDYRLSALYELTSDVRLQMTVTEPSLASIIYDWLVSPDMTPKSQTSRFLDRIGAFSMQGLGEVLPENKAHSPALGDTGFIVFLCEENGRRLTSEFFASIIAKV